MSKHSSSRSPVVGDPIDRVDGSLKVTGGATYAGEFVLPGLAHAVLVTSTVAKGRVRSVDADAAMKSPGVLAVLTPQNAPRLPGAQPTSPAARRGPAMRVPTVLQDDTVHYNGQPIALVVADTFEQATAAAMLVRAKYGEEKPVLDMDTAPRNPPSG